MAVREKLVEIIKFYADFLSQDTIDAIADRIIAEGVTVQDSKLVEIDQFNKWISVKDRLPTVNVGVLVYTPRLKNIFEVFYTVNGKWEIVSYRGSEILNDEVTHWMPLPQPPKGE